MDFLIHLFLTLAMPSAQAEALFDECPLEECRIDSPFGPRYLGDPENRYDFHRGLDLIGEIGDPVTAIQNGEVFRVYPEGSEAYPNGGNVLILKHEEDYSLYFHLDSFDVSEGDAVSAGQKIGELGDTGANNAHLHFEVREGTTCSLSSQLADKCSGDGVDPHINPMAWLMNDPGPKLRGRLYKNKLRVYWRTQEPTLNAVTLTEANGSVHHFDFNARDGFDASSTETLDDAETGMVTWSPTVHRDSRKLQRMDLLLDLSLNLEEIVLEDIWGNQTTVSSSR
jgi:hypothetical protein